jgi:hypothetical protein
MGFIFHPKPERTDIAIGAAYTDHIYRMYISFHLVPSVSLFFVIIAYYPTSSEHFFCLMVISYKKICILAIKVISLSHREDTGSHAYLF